ncbi:hypothetical protein UlMin_029390 [Ulmus minor]
MADGRWPRSSSRGEWICYWDRSDLAKTKPKTKPRLRELTAHLKNHSEKKQITNGIYRFLLTCSDRDSELQHRSLLETRKIVLALFSPLNNVNRIVEWLVSVLGYLGAINDTSKMRSSQSSHTKKRSSQCFNTHTKYGYHRNHTMDIAKSLMNFESVNKKMVRLKRKVEYLESKEADITMELEEAESSGLKKRRREKVRARGCVISNVTELLQNDFDRLENEATELLQNGNFAEGLTVEADERGGVSLLTTDLVGQDFETNKNTICEWLRSDESLIVGVYGLGGVGKTTLLEHVNNQLLNPPGTSVYWVTASQHCSNSVLRNRIADTVGLHLSKYGEEKKKAAQLARTLGGRRGTVLILDDVWDCFHADELGFPIGLNGFKLILSTRSLELCRKMNCQYTIKVESLSDKEAWELFLEKLRHETSLPPQIEVIARSLVRNCDGLPLGIITMAGCMKGVDDICEWRNALEKSKAAQEDMERVFRVLRYSYDNLKDPTVQQCFLYCSLFPEDFRIERDRLIECLIGERLIDGGKSRQAKFDTGHTILNKLENVCLLEGGKFSWGKRYVKMHDLIRDMAIQITSTNPRFLVEAGVGLEDITDEIWSEDLVRVSLMRNPRLSLPSNASPRCPRLLTLLLDHNRIERIPDCFFMHMNELTVLNLSDNPNIKRLPCLEHLTALRRLDISNTGIAEVPQGIEKLVNLRYLNLEGTSIEKIPDLSKLCHLECLKLFRSRVKVRAEEVSSLRKLDYFSGFFYDTVEFNTYVSSWEDDRGPNSYQLFLGGSPSTIWEVRRDVYLTKCSISKSNGGGKSLVLPKEIHSLYLGECDEVTCLCDALENAIHLKTYWIWIEKCKGMKHLFCSSSCCRLPLLQKLDLVDLPNLNDLMEGGTSITSTPSNCIFHSLKHFEVSGCHKMKRLFVHWLLPHLPNLEGLSVRDCAQMEEIIGEASNEDEDQEATRIIVLNNLPNLKHLTLIRLPELKNFCSTSIVRPNSLEQIRVWDCPKLRRMPLLCEEPNPVPSLQKIEVEEEWSESLQWDPPQTKDLYQPLCQFKRIN